jgi:predicted DNA-binding transcriptional regulator
MISIQTRQLNKYQLLKIISFFWHHVIQLFFTSFLYIKRLYSSSFESAKSEVYENFQARHQRLTSVTLATQEAEIRRITVRSQLEQIAHKTLSQKTLPQKIWAGRVVQGESPEFKPQSLKKKKKKFPKFL